MSNLLKILILYFLFAFAVDTFAKDKVVAIIDTGLNLKDYRFQHLLCPYGHRDFSGEGIRDRNGHGSHVFGLIQRYAPATGWCAVIIKVFSDKPDSVPAYKEAWKYLLELKPDYVNQSGGGGTPLEEEQITLKTLVTTKFIVAAGNNGRDLSKPKNNFYPAKYQYKNIIPVGSIDKTGKRAKNSNYGLAYMRWEIGEHVMSTLPIGEGEFGEGEKSGTSMATATATGRILSEDLNK